MNTTPENTAADAATSGLLDDPRLAVILSEYLAEIEAGRRPDRQAFLARHADLAGPLTDCLAALEFVQGTVQADGDGDPGEGDAVGAKLPPSSPSTAPVLSDYQVIREVGRGGMGIVYEAVQRSLGRRVALKMLPETAALDPRHLQRFRNEAHAAAQLRHPNIVPIHAVGHEGGAHFQAMQFIEGTTLAALLEELTATGLAAVGEHIRAVARLGVQAAQALAHAHQVGVIHRDIKPGNLMVEPSGHLWVTDLGLAKLAGADNLTRTSELLGTLRYMSPEQALGETLDHRTDIYSLGATLYQLLTLRAAFPGSDRQEVLRRIAGEEPLPPHRLNPALPSDLETIVLKAMAKEPGERYRTAQELADDLQRFLDDRPIQARRPTLVHRARKWARRHRGMVGVTLGAGFAVLAAGVAILWVSNNAISEKHRAAENALREKKEALDREQEASYFNAVALAHREWQTGNVSQTLALLETCPVSLRHWEWHYLRRLCATELLVLRGHKGPVLNLALAADGRRLASAAPTEAIVWSLDTGRGLHEIPNKQGDVNIGVLFSPDGGALAILRRYSFVVPTPNKADAPLITPMTFGGIALCDADTGAQGTSFPPRVHEFDRFAPPPSGWAQAYLTMQLRSLDYSPDGLHLLAGNSLKKAMVFEAPSLKPLKPHAFSEPVVAAAFSGDGHRLVILGRDGLIEQRDTASGKTLLTIRDATFKQASGEDDNQRFRRRLAYHPDGTCLAAGNDAGQVKIWDALSGRVLLSWQAHTTRVAALAFSPTGDRLASASDRDKVVRIWDARRGVELFACRGHADDVCCLGFTPDGNRLVSGGWDGTLRVWNATTKHDARFLGAVPVVPPPSVRRQPRRHGVSFNPDGKHLAAFGKRPETHIWDTSAGAESAALRAGGRAQFVQLAFSADKSLLHTVDWDGRVTTWNWADGRELQTFTIGMVAERSKVGLGRFAFLEPAQVAFSGDAKKLVFRTANRPVALWDVARGEMLASCPGGGENVTCVGISPDGERVAFADPTSDRIGLWDTVQRQEVRSLPGAFQNVVSFGFSPDGEMLAVGCAGGAIHVLDLASGRERFRAQVPPQPRLCMAFSPDSRRLVVGLGRDDEAGGGVRVWETRGGREALTLTHDSPTDGIAISPNGAILAAVDSQGRIWLYDGSEGPSPR